MGIHNKINWDDPEILAVIKDPTLTNQQKADILGISYWTVSHKRVELGLPHLCWVGIDHKLTNKERKARYNAKIKKIGYKPLYTLKEMNEQEFIDNATKLLTEYGLTEEQADAMAHLTIILKKTNL